jgi:hypothetical protein
MPILGLVKVQKVFIAYGLDGFSLLEGDYTDFVSKHESTVKLVKSLLEENLALPSSIISHPYTQEDVNVFLRAGRNPSIKEITCYVSDKSGKWYYCNQYGENDAYNHDPEYFLIKTNDRKMLKQSPLQTVVSRNPIAWDTYYPEGLINA